MNTTSTIKLNNGVTIPCLGLGVFQANQADTEKAVRWALEAGYRLIDTAKIYGNEKSVGQAVKNSGLPREDIFVTTKLWNDEMRAGQQRQAFELSLKTLGLDYIDLYLIHWPVGNFVETWTVLENIYRAGLVRAIGVSNFQTHHLNKLLATATIVPAVNQIEIHPLLSQQPLVKHCQKAGLICQAWSPLGGNGAGLLKEELIQALSEKYGRTPAQIVLRWDIQRGIIPLPKSVHKDRIVSNADVFDFELSNEDMDTINEMNQNKRIGPDPDNFNF